MSAVTNALNTAGTNIANFGKYVANVATRSSNTLQRKFVEVTDACLPKSIAPLFRNAVISAPITYAALNAPLAYPLLTVAVLVIIESAKDLGGEPRANFPGAAAYKALNYGAGGAFLVTAGKLAFSFGKTLWQVGTIKEPFVKAAVIAGHALAASFFFSREDKPVPTLATLSQKSMSDLEPKSPTKEAAEKATKTA